MLVRKVVGIDGKLRLAAPIGTDRAVEVEHRSSLPF
jgi:hypothetical protein